MKKYPEDFEIMWASFDPKLGAKGSKTRAYEEFKKIKNIHWQSVVFTLSTQIRRKIIIISSGNFSPRFPHVERWIKRRCWEDDLEEIPYERYIPNDTKPSRGDENQERTRQYIESLRKKGKNSSSLV